MHVNEPLGLHWIVDAFDCRAGDLGDSKHLESVLESIPDALGLVRVAEVHTFQHEEGGETTIAGVVLISESHFSIHVRPHRFTLHADLFSCRPFDLAKALELLRAAYGFTRHRERVLDRGAVG